MAASKAKVQQFIDEAQTAIAQGKAFGLSAKQRFEALVKIANFAAGEREAAAFAVLHKTRQ